MDERRTSIEIKHGTLRELAILKAMRDKRSYDDLLKEIIAEAKNG